ncbi:DEAD/DEAH box helicase [Tunicatimonas pelagia]|uniref:DEAD/DEAH box helicase n=1 Tax=Tunicatimonas pelagia TaxID=931531 RepID=UPI00266545D1|nr:DEAD/DEAH box helicase [Tunicatimonas pelagia]WKN40499.1 DEAD/DEAH box helicase [Tunicatimonas pelagia]
MTFQEMGLRPELLQATEELGFTEPTPIQQQAIPVLISENRDLVALAQTGTGKTAAFGLPLLHLVSEDASQVQALVLCPTRELCLQITRDLDDLAKHLPEVRVAAVYGGASMDQQIRQLKRGVQIVVGTPGRVHDLTRRRVLKLDAVERLVLDEADEMLSMGFKEELEAIVDQTPEERQTLLFSATMPKSIAGRFTNNPAEISVGSRNAGASTVKHVYYMVNARDRYAALKRIADLYPEIYGIVFCRTRQETKDVAAKLGADGYNADALHGDLSQAQRDYVMGRFRKKQLNMLVATDVAARGLDVNDLSHVINYNLPDDIEVYTHRSGRTGRAGRTGTSIAIVHRRETGRIKQIERVAKISFERKPVPTGREICEKQLFHLVDRIEHIEVNDEQIDSYLPVIYKKLDWMSREDLIKRFVSVEFNRFLSYYENAPDLNVKADERKSGRDRERGSRQTERVRERRSRTDFTKFYINVGSKHKMNPARLMGLINEHTNDSSIRIGKIDIEKNFTMFEIDRQHEAVIEPAFDGATFAGQLALVQKASSGGPRKTKQEGNFEKRKKKHRKGKGWA